MKELDNTATSQVQESFTGESEETQPRPGVAKLETETPETRKWPSLLREGLETLLLTVIIFVVINTLTGRFRIEGPSMEPTLHEGQYLIINKIIYKLHPPRRGDVVVFHHPRTPKRDLIKRIVGLPGETIEVRQGRVYVDGEFLDEPYVVHDGRYSVRFELGADDFFVLGDNRPNSDDSHNWGTLKGDRIVGQAWLSYWPPDHLGLVSH